MQSVTYPTKHQHCFSPWNWWTIRTNELMDQGLPPTVCHRMTEQLEQTLANSRVCTQFMETQNYQALSTWINHRDKPHSINQHPRWCSTCCAGTTQSTIDCEIRCTTSFTEMHQTPQYTLNLCFRRQGMARWAQPQDQSTLKLKSTNSKKIWTIWS